MTVAIGSQAAVILIADVCRPASSPLKSPSDTGIGDTVKRLWPEIDGIQDPPVT